MDSIDEIEQGKINDTHNKGDTEPYEDKCVICLEAISERAVAVPCNHCTFDFICLVSWLQDHPQCPLCKTCLSAVEYDWAGPDDYKTFSVTSLTASTSHDNVARPPQGSRRGRSNRARGSRHYTQNRNSPRLVDPSLEVSRRRYIYRHRLYSLHVGSNPQSRFRDFTPQSFSKAPSLQSRARTWIRRELRVFDFLGDTSDSARDTEEPSSGRLSSSRNLENAEFLLSYIVSILCTVDIKSSEGTAQKLLADFLGQGNAALLLHELSHWLRSPYTTLESWDRHVQYSQRIPYSLEADTRFKSSTQRSTFDGREAS